MDLARRSHSQHATQIDALDGLRGLAVLLVFLSHTSLREWYLFPGLDFRGFGKSGVYLFFILSAFLLSRNLTCKSAEIFSRTNLVNYSVRRVLRIYPLYSVYILVGLIGYYWVAPDVRFTPQLDIYAAFEHLTLQDGVFIAWSIPVEFKYYFILPLVTWFFICLHRFHLIIGALSLVGLLTLVHVFFPTSDSAVNDTRTIYYLSIFICGNYLGVVSVLATPNLERYRTAWLVVFTLTIGGLAFANPPTAQWLTGAETPNNWSHNWHVYFSLVWGGFLMSVLFGHPLCQRVFEQKWLRFLGLISFSFYLWHFSAIVLVEFYLANMSTYVKAWVSFIAAGFVSTLTYYGIEVSVSRIAVKTG